MQGAVGLYKTECRTMMRTAGNPGRRPAELAREATPGCGLEEPAAFLSVHSGNISDTAFMNTPIVSRVCPLGLATAGGATGPPRLTLLRSAPWARSGSGGPDA